MANTGERVWGAAGANRLDRRHAGASCPVDERGWIQAGDSTAGLFFGQTGSTFALIGRGGADDRGAGGGWGGDVRLQSAHADGLRPRSPAADADEQSLRFVDTRACG